MGREWLQSAIDELQGLAEAFLMRQGESRGLALDGGRDRAHARGLYGGLFYRRWLPASHKDGEVDQGEQERVADDDISSHNLSRDHVEERLRGCPGAPKERGVGHQKILTRRYRERLAGVASGFETSPGAHKRISKETSSADEVPP